MIQDLGKRSQQSKRRDIKNGSVVRQKSTKPSLIQNTIILPLLLKLLAFIFNSIRSLFYFFERRVGRVFFVQVVFVVVVILIISNLWYVFSAGTVDGNSNFLSSLKINTAKRGNIFYRNIKFNRYIPLTTSTISATITYNPSFLATNIKKNIFTLDEVVFGLSANLNINYQELKNTVSGAIQSTNPQQYAVLKKQASESQGEAVAKLQVSNSKLQYNLWLTYEPVESRLYPENKTLGNILGYVQRFKSAKEEAVKIRQCQKMIETNEKRNTVDSFSGRKSDGIYTVGIYGLEQKFCSELGGLNGREQLFSESRASQDSVVQDGADLYLTIDSTLQAKAEDLLSQLIESTTKNGKTPRNGTIIVTNLEDNGVLKAGEVLASASWPTADPNNYDTQKYIESGGFQNVAVSDDYEIGSVMKPFTVASAINEYLNNSTNKYGERLGISSDWKFNAYDPNEKKYTEPDGNTYTIKNVIPLPLGEEIPIQECLYKSINTCLTEIETHISNSSNEVDNNQFFRHDRSEEYYSNRFGFGMPTLTDVPPSAQGLIGNFKEYVNNTFQYANFSFGQGFEITPMQLVRAYTALARTSGTMVEPHLVKSIQYDNGVTDISSSSQNPKIAIGQPVPTVNPQTSERINEWLKYAQDGYGRESLLRGENPEARGYLEGYPMAGKTGTSQVGRPDTQAIKEFGCNNYESTYDCNSRLGITDQTFIQFGPIGPSYEKKYPKILVVIKLSEPNPGVIVNFGLLNIGPYISQMSRFTLEYLGVPPNL